MIDKFQTWRPDTCDCQIQTTTSDDQIFNVIKQCKLHKNLKGIKLLVEVRKHNKKHGYEHLKEFDQFQAKEAEKKRIQKL